MSDLTGDLFMGIDLSGQEGVAVTIIRKGFSIVPGRALRDTGTKQTIEANAEWANRALKWLRLFSMEQKEFTAEQFREHWSKSGFDQPKTHKVWGSLFLTAARQGWLENTGRYVKATSAKTRAHPVPIWRRK